METVTLFVAGLQARAQKVAGNRPVAVPSTEPVLVTFAIDVSLTTVEGHV